MKKIKMALVVCFLLGITLFVAQSWKKENLAQNSAPTRQPADEDHEAGSATALSQAIPSEFAQFNETPKVAERAPVAVVNGTAITAAELKEELDNLLISSSTHAKMDSKKKDDLKKIALEELIVRELAYQKAMAMGLKVDKQEFVASVKKIKNRYKTKKNFQEALKVEEITLQEFEQRIEKDLLLRKIRQIEIEDKAKISDDEAKRYYEQNKASFLLPESIRLKHLVVKAEPGKEDEAKKRIDDIAEKLRIGADFYEMAYKFSEDDYRVLGGDYGSVHRGQIIPELEAMAFEAKPNEITGPFRTSYGWHIIKVESKQAEQQLGFEEVKEKIKDRFYQKRRNERRQQFINDLKAAAQIQYVIR